MSPCISVLVFQDLGFTQMYTLASLAQKCVSRLPPAACHLTRENDVYSSYLQWHH